MSDPRIEHYQQVIEQLMRTNTELREMLRIKDKILAVQAKRLLEFRNKK